MRFKEFENPYQTMDVTADRVTGPKKIGTLANLWKTLSIRSTIIMCVQIKK